MTLVLQSMAGRLIGITPMVPAVPAAGMLASLATILTRLPVWVGMTGLIRANQLSLVCKVIKVLPTARRNVHRLAVSFVRALLVVPAVKAWQAHRQDHLPAHRTQAAVLMDIPARQAKCLPAHRAAVHGQAFHLPVTHHLQVAPAQ